MLIRITYFYKLVYRQKKNPSFKNRLFAARMIGISKESLDDYESGRRFPPDDIILVMGLEVYKNNELIIQAHEKTALGQFLKEYYQNLGK